MKKFSVLIALALLAVAGTGYAVTCAYDNVPAATLLVPYFKVSRNDSTGGDIPTDRGVNTLVAITNVSSNGVIVHASIWNKYSHTVLDWNIPMTGFDVAIIDMRAVLNGNLNSNANLQKPGATDACKTAPGFGQTRYVRFTHPDASLNGTDFRNAISIYNVPAFSGAFRTKVWDSLDESGDISGMNAAGANTVDADNPACPGMPTDGSYAGDFSGYMTLDVVNYCTNWFPDQAEFYVNDAIATSGWGPTYTPNAIMGDIFFIDRNPNGGNISGEIAIPMEYDVRLENWVVNKTFFGRYQGYELLSAGANPFVPAAYRFWGDGREPLGYRYGFRYLLDSTTAPTLQTWAIVWRSDLWDNPNIIDDINLCDWAYEGGPKGYGHWTLDHRLTAFVYDLDEKINVVSGGCPSGVCGEQADLYVFLEAQRVLVAPNQEFNPGNFLGGWADVFFNSNEGVEAGYADPHFFNQAYVGVQHSGAGLASSVGYSATLLNNQFLCSPSIYVEVGNSNPR
ncbi:hypothetical protein FBQ97_01110 [Acidobacteria bacterium ACD]|nr:MAG: hypothetical protein EDX89_13460 [Acidobacteriota bacterium]MCE7956964.1 hypothetical protein [Acidobacteria bacterium ACB2]MDL1948399.1 hypothetical protein [Acidobacteria bacterium ACD]